MSVLAPAAGNRLPVDAHDPLAVDAMLGADELELRERVRGFVRESYLPDADRLFSTGRWPDELTLEIGALDILGLHLGIGDELASGAVAYGLACLELEAGDGSLRRFMTVQAGTVMTEIARHGSAIQGADLLPRLARAETIGAHVTGDSGGSPLVARRRGRDWILQGRATCVGMAPLADLLVVRAFAQAGPVAFLVPTSAEGLVVRPSRQGGPLPSLLSGDVALGNVRVGDDARLSGSIAPEPHGRSAADWALYGHLCGLVGAARAGYESAVDGARERAARGQADALTARRVAEMALAVGAGLLMSLHLGRTWDAGRLRAGQLATALQETLRMAQLVLRTSRDVLGEQSLALGCPVLRHLVNVEWAAAESVTERQIADLGRELIHAG